MQHQMVTPMILSIHVPRNPHRYVLDSFRTKYILVFLDPRVCFLFLKKKFLFAGLEFFFHLVLLGEWARERKRNFKLVKMIIWFNLVKTPQH